MAQVPSAVAQAAGAFGLDAGSLRVLSSAALHDVPAAHRAWACELA
jgi:hypothetical protein